MSMNAANTFITCFADTHSASNNAYPGLSGLLFRIK
jgi:hypothetical protein